MNRYDQVQLACFAHGSDVCLPAISCQVAHFRCFDFPRHRVGNHRQSCVAALQRLVKSCDSCARSVGIALPEVNPRILHASQQPGIAIITPSGWAVRILHRKTRRQRFPNRWVQKWNQGIRRYSACRVEETMNPWGEGQDHETVPLSDRGPALGGVQVYSRGERPVLL